MNLYLVERTDAWGYDEYDSMVVRAASPADAVTISPASWSETGTLADPDDLTVVFLGKVVFGGPQDRGLVLASFNAG